MSNSAKVGSPAKYSTHQNMAAYDKLPKKVRLALMYSDHNWSAGHVRYAMTSKKFKKKSEEIISTIAKNDARIREENTKD